MAPPILTLKNLELSWGMNPLFKGLEMAIGPRDRLCLLGRNGTGKSTLMKVIAGEIEADDGKLWMQPGTRIAYLPQEPDASSFDTLRDYINSGLRDHDGGDYYKVDVIAEELSVPLDTAPSAASGGEMRRAALACALVGEPDILLLDEPTNHLDIATIIWLEKALKSWRGAFVLISHDRAFLNALASACLWLDRGVTRRMDAKFERFEIWQEEVLEAERIAAHKLDKLIAEEARWSVEGISARRTRNQGRMRRLRDLRELRRSQIKQTGSVAMTVAEANGSGARVCEAKNISKSYDGKVIFDDFSLRIARGDRIGIIGPNGVGKTTLLKVLTGEVEPDSGTIRLGTNLKTAYIDQKRVELKGHVSVMDTLTGGGGDTVFVGGEARHVIGYMKDFLFHPSIKDTPVSALSGGERNRLLLAVAFARPSNLMILDEPTNDLDMDTLDLLQEVLADYDGTVLLVSHDRDFIDRLVTSSLVLDGDGIITEYAGGYSDYMRQKQPDSLTQPDRIGTKSSGQKSRGRKATKKLSYKDQRALDMLPAELEAIADKVKQLEAEMSDPELYSKNPERIAAISKEIEGLHGQQDSKETRWLELQEMQESLGG